MVEVVRGQRGVARALLTPFGSDRALDACAEADRLAEALGQGH